MGTLLTIYNILKANYSLNSISQLSVTEVQQDILEEMLNHPCLLLITVTQQGGLCPYA